MRVFYCSTVVLANQNLRKIPTEEVSISVGFTELGTQQSLCLQIAVQKGSCAAG